MMPPQLGRLGMLLLGCGWARKLLDMKATFLLLSGFSGRASALPHNWSSIREVKVTTLRTVTRRSLNEVAGVRQGLVGRDFSDLTVGQVQDFEHCAATPHKIQSMDHRGTPEKPGLVATLISDEDLEALGERSANDPPSKTCGVAYLVPDDKAEAVLAGLDFREKGGYTRAIVDVYRAGDLATSAESERVPDGEPSQSSTKATKALLYTATTSNPNFALPPTLEAAADTIASAVGPSGPNHEYLFLLSQYLENVGYPDEYLTELASMVLSERPSDASVVFEHLSASVKEARCTPANSVTPQGTQAARAAQLKWAQGSQTLFAVPDEPAEGGAIVPDMLDEANMWDWGGVSLGRLETYRLCLAVKKLAATLPGEHESLRFWGKIITRSEDYVIVEGKATDDTVGEFDESLQEGRDGANRYTYWVTRAAGHEWVPLPPVTQAQICAARKIKRYFTGKLEAPVPGYPPFPGNEINLLRAQIARITAGTCVSPAGFFEVDEEAEPAAIKVAEDEAINESFPKPIEELMTPDGWVHHEFELNGLGRCHPMPEKLDEDGNPIEDENPPEEIPPLRSLAEDADGGWGFRTCPAGGGESAHAMIVAKSLLWPGAIAVAVGKRFTNVYCGDGVKLGEDRPYQPPLPPPLQMEWTPGEDEDGLAEQADVLVDPNPPDGEDDEDE